MKKISLIALLLCFSIVSFGQNQSYKGFYQTRFFNFLGDVKVIEAEFEVKDNNAIVGNLKIGDVTKILQGEVQSKGKFEARTESVNGVITLIKGEFPITKNEGKVSLIQRTEQKGNGSKSSSESGISGFIKQMPTPVELKDVGIVDNGKTQLWFQHSTPLFGKEWTDFPATVKINNINGQILIEVEMSLKTAESRRRFQYKMMAEKKEQKIWFGKDLSKATYAEEKNEGVGGSNLFPPSKESILGGKVEIISENENEMVFKITNLRIKRFVGDDFVQIDGYIHAVKNNQQ